LVIVAPDLRVNAHRLFGPTVPEPLLHDGRLMPGFHSRSGTGWGTSAARSGPGAVRRWMR
jgi:hypothetical protein